MSAVAIALMEAVRNAGGTIALHGDNLRITAPLPLPELLRTSLRAHKPALVAYLTDVQAAANANQQIETIAEGPTDPANVGLPAQLATGLRAVAAAPAARGIPELQWRRIIGDTLAFVTSGQAATALTLGWNPERLFGCDAKAPWHRIDRAGVVMLIDGRKITEITADSIALTSRDGAVVRCRNPHPVFVPPLIMLWHLLPKRLRPNVGPAP